MALAFIIHLIAWTYVFALNRSSPLSKAYLIYIGSIMAWLLIDLVGRIVFTLANTPLWYLRLMSLFWLYMGLGMLHFIYVLLDKKYDFLFKMFACSYPVFLILSFTTKLTVLPNDLFMIVLLAGVCAPSVYGIYLIIHRLILIENRILHLQLKLIIAGIVTAMIISLATDVIPQFMKWNFGWRLASAITAIQAFFVLPAMLKFHFIAFPVGETAFGLFTNANEAIIAIDNEGKILRTNSKANELFQFSPEKSREESILSHLKDFTLGKINNNFETVLLQYPEISVNISQTTMKFGGYEQGKVLIIRDITERTRAAAELKKSEGKYRTLVETTSDIIYYLDIMGNFTYINPAFERISGYKVEEIIDTGYNALVREDYLQKVQEEFNSIFQERKKPKPEGSIITTPTITKDGRELWMELNVKLIMVEDWVAGYAVVSRDITDRHKAEEKLKESEDRYKKLVENLPDAIIVHDGKEILFANQKAADFADVKSSETLHGKTIAEFIHSEDKEMLFGRLEQLFNGESLDPIETKLLDATGKTIIVETQGVLINFNNKLAVQTVFRDITEKKIASDALKSSEARLRKLIETSPDGIIINDFEKIYFINEAGADIIGEKPESIMGKPFMQFIHPREIDKFKDIIRKLKRGEKVSRFDIAVKRKDGTERIIEAKGTQTSHDGKPAILSFLRDITERIQAENEVKSSRERLTEAQRMARIGSFQYNLQTGQVIWSEALFYIYGLDKDSYKPSNSKFQSDVVHPHDRDYIINLVDEAIKNKQPTLDYFHKIVQPDGSEKIMHALAQIIYDDNSEALIINGSAQDVTELHDTRMQLEDSEKSYRELVELSPDAVLITDKEKILFVNKTFINIMGGKHASDFLNKKILPFIHQDSIDTVFEELDKMDQDIPIATTQIKAIKLDGSSIYTEIRGMLTNFNNKPAVMCSIRDVSEKIIAGRQLRQSESNLSRAQEIAKLGSWEYQYDKEQLIFSKVCRELFGFTMNEKLTVEKYWAKVHPDDYAWLKKKYDDAKKKKCSFQAVYRICPQENQASYLREYGEFVIDDNGQLLKVIGTVLDVTEIETARLQVEKNEENYRSLYDHAPTSYFSISTKGIILNCNQRVKELLGFSTKELIGTPVINLYEKGKNGQDKAKIIFKKFLKGSKIIDEELVMVSKSKSPIWVSVTIEPLKDKDGKVIESRSMVVDITERKKAEKEIKEYRDELRNLSSHIQNLQEEERGRIAREIHDELGQNLTGINMDIMYLKNKAGTDSVSKDILQRLNSASKLIDHTIKSIRRISQELRPSILDDLGLKTAMEWQVEQFKKRSNLDYILTIEDKNIKFNNAQATAIFRIMQESLTNIARHAEASSVEIYLHLKNSSVLLEIKDDGKGITEQKGKAFNKTFGIFGMKERASVLGGSLEIKSKVNQGTTVNLILPLKSENGEKL